MSEKKEQPKDIENQDKKKSKSKLIIIVLIFFLIVLSLITCGLIYWFLIKDNISEILDNEDQEEEQQENDITEDDSEEENNDEIVESEIPEFWKGKIIYKDNFNLFLSEKDGSNKIQLTEFEPQSSSFIVDPQLINENILGFGKCYYEEDGPDCTIYRLNVKTKDLSTIKELKSGDRLVQLTWDNVDTYAYVLAISSDMWKIIYSDNGEETLIDSYDQVPGGRGGIMEDCIRLRFSLNGEKLFYINTTGQKGLDFTVYVYGVGNKICEIEDATMPIWKGNNSIVYVYVSQNDSTNIGKLYEMDLTNLEFEEIEGAYPSSSGNFTGSYDTSFYDNRIIYWGVLDDEYSEGKVQDYNFKTKDLYTNDGSWIRPVVLSESEFILSKTTPASEQETAMPDSFENLTGLSIDGNYILNIDTGEKTEISINDQYLLAGIITWYHRYLYY